MNAIQKAIEALCEGTPVGSELAGRVARQILKGQATPAQIGGFLTGLRARGETIEHLVAFARVMRQMATPVEMAPSLRAEIVDTCGTGGDGKGTFNVSTVAALIAAGAGAKIAKHGNRSASGVVGGGSADALIELGVKIDCSPETSVRCVEACGLGFFFAPAYHGAMRHAAPVRRELGARTIFNLLGPLANPAGARRQLVGVFRPELTEIHAAVLAKLGAERAWVVHGEDGLDELTLTGPTRVVELRDGKTRAFMIDPRELGLKLCRPEDLAGGEGAAARAAIVREIIEGRRGPRRSMAELNAAAALMVAGLASSLAVALALARASVDSGAAEQVLERLVTVSNEP
jgi:anthranilate phosphoribosyltransferase